MKHIVFIILSIWFAAPMMSHAQTTVSYTDPYKDSVKSVWDNNISVFKDQRIDILVKKHRDIQMGLIRSDRGYRVQIYYGSDRNEAIKRNVDFMRRYPGIKTYMVYTRPQYRVKVGDFQTRQDAVELYRETIALYGACMIVPDKIVVNTLQDD